MEVRAMTKYVHISPQKASDFSRTIQGKKVVDALAMVELSPRKAARLFGKTLRSALANAENNYELKRDHSQGSGSQSGPDAEKIPSESAWYGRQNQKTYEPLHGGSDG